MFWRMAADALVVIHLGFILFVMLGVLMLALGTAWYLRANRMEPAAAGGAGAGTALPVGRKRGRHTR